MKLLTFLLVLFVAQYGIQAAAVGRNNRNTAKRDLTALDAGSLLDQLLAFISSALEAIQSQLDSLDIDPMLLLSEIESSLLSQEGTGGVISSVTGSAAGGASESFPGIVTGAAGGAGGGAAESLPGIVTGAIGEGAGGGLLGDVPGTVTGAAGGIGLGAAESLPGIVTGAIGEGAGGGLNGGLPAVGDLANRR